MYGFGALLERQADVQADRLAAGLVRAAVGGLHDARTAAGRHDEAVMRRCRAPRDHVGQHAARARALPRSSATTRRRVAAAREISVDLARRR